MSDEKAKILFDTLNLLNSDKNEKTSEIDKNFYPEEKEIDNNNQNLELQLKNEYAEYAKILDQQEKKKPTILTDKNKFCLGHRDRVKKKFKSTNDTSIFQEYEILEMMFFALNPRMDVKNIAKSILERFKTIKKFLDADEAELKALFKNNIDNMIFVKKLFREVINRYYKPDNNIEKWNMESIVNFIKTHIANLRVEKFLIIFFNTRLQIIHHEIEAVGTIDEITVYIRNILKKAVSFDAKSICIAHNHPSGDCSPSVEDINFTDELVHASKSLKIIVKDHIIVSPNDNFFSFYESNLI